MTINFFLPAQYPCLQEASLSSEVLLLMHMSEELKGNKDERQGSRPSRTLLQYLQSMIRLIRTIF
jgi:hypothetical protein